MERKAIIMGSNYDGTLSGVAEDINTWGNFLTKPIGGGWYNSEIEVVPHATTCSAVQMAIKLAANVDYAFICFSGHGGIYQRKKDFLGMYETFICLDKNEIISERLLNPGAGCSRCTILLDCCRCIENINESMVKVATESLRGNLDNIETARKIFDKQLEKSEKGCTKIYSASIEQSAADEKSFSRAMVKGAELYLSQNKNIQLVTLDQAVKNTSMYLEPQQTPQYLGGRRLHHFPFAVNPLIYEEMQ